MSRLRQGDPTVAVGAELDIIAAVVIGGGSLSGGEGRILGSMIGALIMAFPAQWLPADGLAQLYPGDHHRRNHRHCSCHRSLPSLAHLRVSVYRRTYCRHQELDKNETRTIQNK